jgi:hypothetical protein
MKNKYFEFSRAWFDFCFANPDKIKPVHTAVFMFILEHNNRLAWREAFGLPTMMVCEAVGIRSVNTYRPILDDIEKWGFIKILERSKNQYSSNIVALSNSDVATDKALDIAIAKATDKALDKHHTKHSHHNNTLVTKENSNNGTMEREHARASFPTIEQCRQIAQMSGHEPEYGEAYFHMRDADGWCKPRGKGENMQMIPIANWRSDYANMYNQGYLKYKNDTGLPF